MTKMRLLGNKDDQFGQWYLSPINHDLTDKQRERFTFNEEVDVVWGANRLFFTEEEKQAIFASTLLCHVPNDEHRVAICVDKTEVQQKGYVQFPGEPIVRHIRHAAPQ